jgi:nicotinamide mononucleotide (NMN) deamidase PncC/nicotinic acid mononucleotide adenylyltransferase
MMPDTLPPAGMADPPALAPVPAASTLFLPVTGNPIGFNHFALAEWLLRRNPAWQRVVFVVANGRHPDPTKPDAEVSPAERFAIAQAAVAAIADPERCFLARQAALAGETLVLTPERVLLDPREFAVKAPVRTLQLVNLLRESGLRPGDGEARLHWAVGADLVRRMADPDIFSDGDVHGLAERLEYAILDREGDPARAAVERVRQCRGVSLSFKVYDLGDVPPWLAAFLPISSTLVRHAAQAGDPLGGMLPLPAAELIVQRGLYRTEAPVAKLVTTSGSTLGARTALQLTLVGLQGQLDQEAAAVAALLVERRAREQPHGIAIGEGSVGGVLTQALAGRSGASRYFRQARFFYDRQAKLNLLGEIPEGLTSVDGAMVAELAKALRRESAADYALTESGMAGPPDGIRRSMKYGQCWIALAGPGGVQTERVALNPFLTRKEHMLQFSRRALQLLRRTLEKE